MELTYEEDDDPIQMENKKVPSIQEELLEKDKAPSANVNWTDKYHNWQAASS